MANKRKKYSDKFKFKVALEAAKELDTLSQIASKHGVHPSQVKSWKKQLLEEGETLFARKSSKSKQEEEQLVTDLYEQIGRLNMDLAWLKKKSGEVN